MSFTYSRNICSGLLIALSLLLLPVQTFAISPTLSPAAKVSPTPSPTPSPNPQDINLLNQLKEKIASKVAQLNLVEKRGIAGTVVDASSTQITLNDVQNNTRYIDVDEITSFSSPTSSTFGISDLTKGTFISVLGLYNKDSRRILARFITVMNPPSYSSGIIRSIDRINGRFTIVDENQKPLLIDVEAVTKTYDYTQANDMTRSGFSKLQVGDTVFIMGYPDKTTPSMIVANRITDFPEIAKDPKINIALPTVEPTISITPTPIAGSSAKSK